MRYVLAALAMLLLLTGCQHDTPSSSNSTVALQLQDTVQDIGGYPYEEVSDAELSALHEALDNEYHALALYREAAIDFGKQQPFGALAAAEEDHVVMLLSIHERYDLPIIDDLWTGTIKPYSSVLAACQDAQQLEQDSLTSYGELLSEVDNQDITAVFKGIQRAALDAFIPALASCGATP